MAKTKLVKRSSDVPVAPASPKRLPRGDLKARMHRFNFPDGQQTVTPAPDSQTPDSPGPKITGGLRRLSSKHESPKIKKEHLDDDATHTVQPKEMSKRWSTLKEKAPADGAKKLQEDPVKKEEKAPAVLSRLTKVLQEEAKKVKDAKKTKELAKEAKEVKEAKELAAAYIAKEKLDKQRKMKAEEKEKDDAGEAEEEEAEEEEAEEEEAEEEEEEEEDEEEEGAEEPNNAENEKRGRGRGGR